MRNLLMFSAIVASFLLSCNNDEDTNPFQQQTISMGTNSNQDVYYSLDQGTVSTVTRTDWDIEFSTSTQSATIRINEGAGVQLYCVGDTNQWDSFVSFDAGSYSELLNDKTDWSIGAFNQNASSMINFGWGTYNMVEHNVYADSIYVIKLSDGNYKKLFIRERNGLTGTYFLRWANVDGSDEVNTSFSCAPYVDQVYFIQYSIVNSEVVEAEPSKDNWDFMFTRYNIVIPAGPGMEMVYPVTGVLSNPDVSIAKVTGVPVQSANITDSPSGFSSVADAIGYDWKESDPVTHEISLVDSLSYFIEALDGKTYQLYFTEYGGLDQGIIDFETRTIK